MIIHVLLSGLVQIRDPHDFKRFSVMVEGTPADKERTAKALNGLARIDGFEYAWVSEAALRANREYAADAEWQGEFGKMVDYAASRGWTDPERREIRAHIEWTHPSRRQRTVHGVSLGILMLDTGFERLPGDVGNGLTWPFPVQYAVVRGATSKNIVTQRIDPALFELFVKAAEDLVRLGVDGITTSCGFLALLHPILKERIAVPVATSSLLQIPLVQQTLPTGKRVGVLTMSEQSLTAEHFKAVGAPTDLPVAGIPFDSKFRQSQYTNQTKVSFENNEIDMFEAAERLLTQNPDVGALVLECTNMPPYAGRLQERFGVPVYDIYSMITWFHAGLQPRRYPSEI